MTAGDVLPPDGTQSTAFRKVRGSKMGSKGRRIFTHGEANPQPCGDPTEKKGGRNLTPKLGPLITKYLTAPQNVDHILPPIFLKWAAPNAILDGGCGQKVRRPARSCEAGRRGRNPHEFYNAALQSEQKSTD